MPLRSEHERDLTFGFLDRETASARRFHPRLITNDGRDTMLRAILRELGTADSFVFSVAFVTPGAIAALKQTLLGFAGRGMIVTSTYLGFNSPAAFAELLNLPVEVLVLDDAAEGFHAKGYLFRQENSSTAIIGSSNLTEAALQRNQEWNLRFSALADGDIVHQLEALITRQVARATPLTAEWVEEYRQTWVPPRGPAPSRGRAAGGGLTVLPNAMQGEALAQIDLIRARGERRAIVVSATGTGKTILSALDVRAVAPRRLLFVVHREQILDKAITEFQRVLDEPEDSFGKVAGGLREWDRRYVFATVQSLNSAGVLEAIHPETFDYVLIDEVHRAGAGSYRRLLDHLRPAFLLGMTATPERTDGRSIFELFDYNLAYEIRLQRALESDMLAPFHYYGVTDHVAAGGEPIGALAPIGRLVSDERADHLVSAVETYGQVGVPVRGLIFCSRNDEASGLSGLLNERRVHGRALRTRALSGQDPVAERERAVADLEAGRLDYLLTVDIFNEGVDVPAVNQVVMLRQTKSSIVFTQQLGRGLRKAAGKDYLVVIDFIGNYTNNYLIPIALLGDNSLSKDSIRQRLIEAQEAGAIAGNSSVSFDAIARDRVLTSLAQTTLDSMANLKAAYLDLASRLGTVPRLFDFARFDAVDPVVLATKEKNYWRLLTKFAGPREAPAPHLDRMLNLLTQEVLNGKRPQELVLLDTLLREPTLTLAEAVLALAERGLWESPWSVSRILRVLTVEHFPAKDRKPYLPVVQVEGERVSLTPGFLAAMQDPTFAGHVRDVVETGLFLSRQRYGLAPSLQVGQRYSRKDALRLLNWERSEYSTVYGYKVDHDTGTCPIFVTYHKHEHVEATVAYDDEFLDESTMRWFTRSRRTLASGEVRALVEQTVVPHLFVKRDDTEGRDFLYLGTAAACDAGQDTMPDRNGDPVPVVTMRLVLDRPVERGLYDYLTTPSAAAEARDGAEVSWAGRVEAAAALPADSLV